jgi:serine acetyltransferase
MPENLKYRLLPKEEIVPCMLGWNSGAANMYRIEALRDIPLHGVKAGDLGGYVNSPKVLSQNGSAWIADNAMVLDNVVVQGNAYVGGNAIVCSRFSYTYIVLDENTKVMDYAQILIPRDGEDKKSGTTISGNVEIYGHAVISEVGRISGNVKICDNVFIEKADRLIGDISVWGNVKIGKAARVFGKTDISGSTVLEDYASVTDSSLSGHTVISMQKPVSNVSFHDGFNVTIHNTPAISEIGSASQGATALIAPAQQQHAMGVFAEIKEDIASYETDIVKIIKYPVMTDRTDPYTRDMIMALKNARRYSSTPSSQEFLDSVIELEKAFLAAESKALKISSANLSDAEKKKTEKAKDLFRIASNEASTEHEKKVAFVQGFKQLEGVIAVPEVAVDAFRVKVGLKEIEGI